MFFEEVMQVMPGLWAQQPYDWNNTSTTVEGCSKQCDQRHDKKCSHFQSIPQLLLSNTHDKLCFFYLVIDRQNLSRFLSLSFYVSFSVFQFFLRGTQYWIGFTLKPLCHTEIPIPHSLYARSAQEVTITHTWQLTLPTSSNL